ncbi:hypothetical protein A3D42_00640 [Candidatus Nomurabacteria bacterium RIFCSPHIGHO2_02_FULL_41_18]|uniref:Uncharacterized protein n=1 Tax=Candidatus Nomurabacteria bacterium RIFCSPHIGHO2_02_FULL_41_18 TaxID=1801754 RepID=A0A1F6W7B0_9BACT|nr:MAG: hypothetical protein A2737_02965 [Candidatus Nomurabacteria bacterium RIFCSPHIGHO2_01_FULL_41_71]OGI77793.1 MAG: hypothetical protein A3D42_00640 [Candidatus Nomurabacteria bacterium RIFCSPHIGHO2_02_FULL_41_18]OGI89941.1 MAG: hypothetical protein A3B01_01710 [Candidatus Nomurabacteria bacterium RIFCSPLOWO2_01_FULL_41_52b]OGJ00350.1 MAG: hypothetical protein A3I90_01330 [Candidatus Nomurabacteria bacterium RIFCSPLOWO2_02_FULL_41_9]
MTTKTALASFESPRHGYFFTEDTDEAEMATSHQKRALTDLIFQNIEEDKRDGYLSQIQEITKSEAADWILEFTMGKWR